MRITVFEKLIIGIRGIKKITKEKFLNDVKSREKSDVNKKNLHK